jgi:predicted RNA-binding protein with PIN domain
VYLVDGYNLLHSLRSEEANFPRDFGSGRRELVELLHQFAVRETIRIRVYFDGTPGRGNRHDLSRPSLAIEYTGDNEADEAIRAHVANAAHPKRLHVVTSDRAIVMACRGEGARIIDSPTFARRLVACNRKAVAAANAEIESRRRKEWSERISQLREHMLGIGPTDMPGEATKNWPVTPHQAVSSLPAAQKPESARLRAVRETTPVSPTPKQEFVTSNPGEMSSVVAEMLEQVGSFEDVVREALGAPFPDPSKKLQPSLPDYYKARKRARSSGSGRTRAVG